MHKIGKLAPGVLNHNRVWSMLQAYVLLYAAFSGSLCEVSLRFAPEFRCLVFWSFSRQPYLT